MIKLQHKVFDYFLLYLFPILATSLFHYNQINQTLVKGAYYLIWVITAIYIGKVWIAPKPTKIFGTMRYIIYAMLFSCIIMSYLLWNQSFILSFRIMVFSLPFIYFLFLWKCDFDEKDIEKLVIFLFIVHIIVWLYAFISFPNKVLGDLDREADESRGILRIFVGLEGGVILTFFMSLNKWFITKKKEYIALIAVSYIFIIFMVTRQVIFFTTCFGLLYVFKKNKNLILALMLLVAVGSNYISFSDDSIFGSLINLTKEQSYDNKKNQKNIRIRSYEKFFTEYTKDDLGVLAGNGIPHSLSSFGKYQKKFTDRGFFPSDVGYAKTYIVMGVLGLILYALLFFNIWKAKPTQYFYYTKIYMFYCFAAHIASNPFFTADTIFMSIALYMLDKNNIEYIE